MGKRKVIEMRGKPVKKKVCAVLLGTALTCHVPLVYGAVQDYQAVTEADKEDNKIFQAIFNRGWKRQFS